MKLRAGTVVLVVVFLAGSSVANAQTQAEMMSAGKAFADNCQSCHQPPNPAFAPERAWIDAIRGTA